MLEEFKKFAMRGNVVDMAVGIIIGGAFGTIVKSLVDDVIMPPIGLLLGGVDFSDLFITLKEGATAGPYATVEAAKEAGAVTLNAGLFINSVISFTIVAFAVFLLIKGMNSLQKKEEEAPAEPTEKECPHCFTSIPIKATRCPHCTSELS
ncbi:MAG: large-conductance mechanosensitive channel protein MscL [Gammaproteobacteria bacterium]|nr:large-conductance mechanosensitive channel protein MscL [Gammaproteobacteria bacterium]MCP5299816.1 large-conductance mechanosensitive channel protein MscL [Chromatiaceae bacterium]